MTVLEILTKARDLFSDPSKLDRNNHFDPNGIIGVLGGSCNGAYVCLAKILEKRGWGSGNLSGFASKSTNEDVLTLFSEAITNILNDQNK